MHFLAKYGKTYATKSDVNTRFAVFSDNFDRIQAHNSIQAGEKFKMGINQFTDMTETEFSKIYGINGLNNVKPTKTKNTERPILTQAVVPELVDWHKDGKMTVPSD